MSGGGDAVIEGDAAGVVALRGVPDARAPDELGIVQETEKLRGVEVEVALDGDVIPFVVTPRGEELVDVGRVGHRKINPRDAKVIQGIREIGAKRP